MPLHFADYRQHVNTLVDAALAAADPARAVRRYLQRDGHRLLVGEQTYDLGGGRVFLVAVGKAAVPMSLASLPVLQGVVAGGAIVAKATDTDWAAQIEQADVAVPASISLYQAGHPVSNETSVEAATALFDLLAQTQTGDLVLCLISGGASALLAKPRIPLAEWQRLTEVLLGSGCTINELNAVRRQLDAVKGGGLVRWAAPARCVGLILSDVVGSPLPDIGSGPTAPTAETPETARRVLERYGVVDKLETAVWQRIQDALDANPLPTFEQVESQRLQNVIIGDVKQAATAVLTRAAQLGFIPQLLTTHLEGEAREVGRVAAALAKDTPSGRCLILGGETTVTLHGDGRGGRNQELALAAAIALKGWPGVVVAGFASDGEDGPTDAAGAVVTGETAELAHNYQLDPQQFLRDNDSFTFFTRLDRHLSAGQQTHLRTGATGTNVNDLLLILTY